MTGCGKESWVGANTGRYVDRPLQRVTPASRFPLPLHLRAQPFLGSHARLVAESGAGFGRIGGGVALVTEAGRGVLDAWRDAEFVGDESDGIVQRDHLAAAEVVDLADHAAPQRLNGAAHAVVDKGVGARL